MEKREHKDTGIVEFRFSEEEFEKFKKIVTVLAAACAVGFAAAAYSSYSMADLHSENDLYQNQLRLAEEKMNTLSDKIDNVERMSEEVRNMVTGQASDRGMGGASTVPDINREYWKGDRVIRTPRDLLAKLVELDELVEAEMKKLIGLRADILSRSYTARVIYDAYEANAPSMWPVLGEISSPFGWRESPYGIGSSYHEGVDILTDYGVPVRVTADGMVTKTGWVDGYGYLVEVSHAGGVVTRYGHNSSIVVYEGQTVRQGDTVALAGSTGNSTGPHSHYEVRIHGTAVDPMLFLK